MSNVTPRNLTKRVGVMMRLATRCLLPCWMLRNVSWYCKSKMIYMTGYNRRSWM